MTDEFVSFSEFQQEPKFPHKTSQRLVDEQNANLFAEAAEASATAAALSAEQAAASLAAVTELSESIDGTITEAAEEAAAAVAANIAGSVAAASASAVLAEEHAETAETQAGVATAQAVIATQAAEDADSASTAAEGFATAASGSASAASGSAVASAASAAAAAASVATLPTPAMKSLQHVRVNLAADGFEAVPRISVDTSYNVGSGETFTTLGAFSTALRYSTKDAGVRIDVVLTSDVTETSAVLWDVGDNVYLSCSGSSRTITLAAHDAFPEIANSNNTAGFFVPKNNSLKISGSLEPIFVTNFGSSAYCGVCALGAIQSDNVLGPFKIGDATGTKPTNGIYLHGATAEAQFVLGDCGVSRTGLAEATVIHGAFNRSSASSQAFEFQSCLVRGYIAPSLSDLLSLLTYNSDVDMQITENRSVGANGLLTAFASNVVLHDSDTAGYTLTADANCNGPVVYLRRSRLIIDNVDFDISSAGASCTNCVSGDDGSEIVARGSTFTGSGGDYALYGAKGTRIFGSGNTYTTLTGSNLTSTWAAGGQYLNA
jgi:hypothetical protein